jgi:hypothetical protein
MTEEISRIDGKVVISELDYEKLKQAESFAQSQYGSPIPPEEYGKKSRFFGRFLKKKMPKYKAMDEFNNWLREPCEHQCFLCDDCEKKIRGIIDSGWKWIEKIESKSP